jgi:hypothetical protein
MKKTILAILAMLILAAGSLQAQNNILSRGPLRSFDKASGFLYTSPDTMVTDTVTLRLAGTTYGQKSILFWTLGSKEYMVIRDFTVGNFVSGQATNVWYGISIGKVLTVGGSTVSWNWKQRYANVATGFTSASFPKDFVIGPGPLRVEILLVNALTSTWVVGTCQYRLWVQFYKPY